MIYQKNLTVLKNRYSDIFNLINQTVNVESNEYQIVESKTLVPTLLINCYNKKFYLHSKYDPVKEAERFIEENYDEKINDYIIYGFGFGYHIRELINRNKNANIYVFETNKEIFRLALKYVDLQEILENPNLKLIIEDKIEDFAKQFNKVLNINKFKLIIHLPSLQAMPEEYVEIKYLLENYRIQEHTTEKYKDVLEYNFRENIQFYDANVDVLFDKLKDVPIIIVAAGPSLDKNKHLLKEVKNKAIIFSVGTALKPLVNEGIYPDICIITDPQDIVYNQIEGLNIDIPIIVLSTCNHKIMKSYNGFKFIALQEGYDLAEAYAKINNNKLVKTGGSVATTALDIAIKFGCTPIIFVGLDLAYTDNKTHVKGTYFYQEIENIKNLRPITGINGKTIYTSKNLYMYLKWIEKRISEEKHITFINATEGGARIEGTIAMSLGEVINDLIKDKRSNFNEIIEQVKINIKRI